VENFQFSAIERLCGKKGYQKLTKAHVLIIGVGGVGSWTAEALARSGVGELTLIDPDSVCITNVNRQLLALSSTVGQSKVEVLKKRFQDINPHCKVNIIEEFFNKDTVEDIFSSNYTYAFDGIDRLKNKLLFIQTCKKKEVPFIISGGAGGKIDPTMIRVCDLGEVYRDRLLFSVRKKLRQDFKYPKGKNKMKITCVFSPEQTRFPQPDGGIGTSSFGNAPKKLDCHSSIGSCTHTTAIFGMMAAGHIVNSIIGE
jgi:tRNA threonylcarbamoyladenosine dehydratase